jgi:putative transposase
MCMDAQHTEHVTSKLAYHFVWCPKYRKKILTGKFATFVEREIHRICETNTSTIGALTVQADHVHLCVSSPPECFSLANCSHAERHDRTPRVSVFPEIKKQLWAGARHGLVRTQRV